MNIETRINQTNDRQFQMLERVHQHQPFKTTPRPLQMFTNLRRK